MRKFFHRFATDVRQRRYLDAYAVGFLALVMMALTVFGDNLPDDYRWAVVFAGIGILVLRLTAPENRVPPGGAVVIGDRARFEDDPLAERLKRAEEVCIFAPSAVNVLDEQTGEILRKHVLGRRRGKVRIVVLDPREESAVALAVRQLDESLEYRRRDFPTDLNSVVAELERMARWDVEGEFDHRFLPYNPGFSLVVLNRHQADGAVTVEVHGFHNETTAGRMHFELTREENPRWFEYWASQFDRIWAESRAPEADDVVPTTRP
ncbi:hypothetical protein [Saccharopolyspora sp. CA-218241]|uniref:hypothetical protein n=1 Tax=Saccharopolyspora sp. CA-218241 TaxID=3240027 RepID=UPI003D982539